MCLPSLHVPSPPPRADTAPPPDAAGLPYALASNPEEPRVSCHLPPPRAGGPPVRGAKAGAAAQSPPGRGPSAAKPLVLEMLSAMNSERVEEMVTYGAGAAQALAFIPPLTAGPGPSIGGGPAGGAPPILPRM